MSAAKPKRIKFSEEEKFLILEEFSLRKDILIPKSGRYRNTQDRQRAWEEIAAAVNALSPVVRRTAEEIRRKWHNMVLEARRELAAHKHPLLRQRPQERLFHHIFALFNKPAPPLAPSFGLPAAAPDLPPHGPAPDGFPGPEDRLQPPPGPAAPPQGTAPGPPPGNPEPPRVKCPPSPALAWPCLEAMASPASLGTGSPGPPEPPHDNGGTAASQELSEKQRRLHTEILELQKETLQLQKEKIVLEKEKLLLEILKLRRELGT
ncbi:myb-related transcription factor, partner of profilin-like [Cyrtonyx montezumae]|uniref:myb-related transcription factor, partner of profilin-like n=1 Tax=Cyrtonyx montezumae TaxID=9017 RepID=UPI0032DBD570